MGAPVTFRPGGCKCTRYQGEGIAYSRCGSLAKMGLPVADLDPEIAHAFEPGCGSAPPRTGRRNSTLARSPDWIMLCLKSSERQLVVSVRYISKPASQASRTVQGRGA